MAKIYDVHSVIVPAQSPVLSAHSYTEIYGGTTGCSIVVNGQLINMGSSSSIFIGINTVSGGTGCYLLGSHSSVFNGDTDFL